MKNLRRDLMEILACPICKFEDLQLYVFEESDEIDSGLIFCSNCKRYYPIQDTIPRMLPDSLRKQKEDIVFLQKFAKDIPEEITKEGKPWPIQ
ncbi:MAG: Trm112 family protein [Candidatus Hodarchaeales archaeon]